MTGNDYILNSPFIACGDNIFFIKITELADKY